MIWQYFQILDLDSFNFYLLQFQLRSIHKIKTSQLQTSTIFSYSNSQTPKYFFYPQIYKNRNLKLNNT